MNGYLDDIRSDYADPLDEERVWLSEYGDHCEKETGEVLEVVESYAETIESTLNAVTEVKEINSPPFGGLDDGKNVLLVVIIGRTADKGILEDTMGVVNHEILQELIE